MKNSLENAKKKYPQIEDIDLHFYGMKGYGISDSKIVFGRPKFHLIGENKLFSLVPLVSSNDSPYVFEQDKLKYNGQDLPFKVKNIGRLGRNPSYFYYRGIQEWIPTLDSETILSINFQPVCKGCEWCCREIGKGMRNLSPEQGVEVLKQNKVNFSSIDKMTFVTGMYHDEDKAVENIAKITDLTKKEGFRGRILYIGAQINSAEQIKRLLTDIQGTRFKYAYTLETFTKRERLHIKKNHPLEEILETFNLLKDNGVEELEYSYMPGIDSLKEFFALMPRFSDLARPHLSIFRIAEEGQENLKDPEFLNDPVGYLCSMRTAFEKQHGSPVYQNNLASPWGFPVNRINPLFLTDKVSLG